MLFLLVDQKKKTDPVVEEIQKLTENQNVEFLPLDLSSFDSVLNFVQLFREKNLPLNLLINNAGVMLGKFKLTTDGFENHFGTNHLGHFLLTVSLIDLLEQNQPSRIVNLSSGLHSFASSIGIDFENINNAETYSEWGAYSQSKLANILFSVELDKRLQEKKIYVNSIDPGFVETDLPRTVYSDWNWFNRWLFSIATKLFAKPPETGALNQLYAATSPEIEKKILEENILYQQQNNQHPHKMLKILN